MTSTLLVSSFPWPELRDASITQGDRLYFSKTKAGASGGSHELYIAWFFAHIIRTPHKRQKYSIQQKMRQPYLQIPFWQQSRRS